MYDKANIGREIEYLITRLRGVDLGSGVSGSRRVEKVDLPNSTLCLSDR